MNAPQASASRAGAVPASAPTFKTLRLMIDRIVADQPTREIDKDEITLTAVVPLARKSGGDKSRMESKAERGKTIDAGKFKKGDVRDFNPPRLLAEVPIGGRQGDWPRELHATVVMVEVDEGKLEPIVNQVIDAVDKEVAEFLSKTASAATTALASAALAGAGMGAPVPLIGPAVGAAVAAASAAAFIAIKKAQEDDPFRPKDAVARLTSYPTRAGKLTGSDFTLKLTSEKGGNYRVIGWWEVA